MKFDVLYEDAQMIAFNKPSGLLSIPDRFKADLPNLHKEAEKQYGHLFVVHRIDKDTSGILIFAKNEAMHKYLNDLFQNRRIEKYYIALIKGIPDPAKGSIRAHIIQNKAKLGTMRIHKSGLPSHTDYEILKKWNTCSLLKLQLHTGRTHQIRVHLQFIGHPVIGDKIYGDGRGFYISSIKKNYKLAQSEEEERPILDRLALHASELVIPMPDRESIRIHAPLFKDMKAAVQQLDKWQ